MNEKLSKKQQKKHEAVPPTSNQIKKLAAKIFLQNSQIDGYKGISLQRYLISGINENVIHPSFILDEIEKLKEQLSKKEQKMNEDVSSISNHIETLDPIIEQNLKMDGCKGISLKFQCFNKQNE